MRIGIWYRRDLRVHDHLPLHIAALERHEVIGFTGRTPEELLPQSSGLNRWGEFKLKFYQECISDLSDSLNDKGVRLLYADGNPVEIWSKLFEELALDEIWFYRVAGEEEREWEEKLSERFPTRAFEGQSLLGSENLPFPLYRMPRGFTSFRKKVEGQWVVNEPVPEPQQLRGIAPEHLSGFDLPSTSEKSSDKRTAYPFRGGEKQGKMRLESWMWEGDYLRHYKETRNGLLGTEYSSKFSAYLAWGCLSPRWIHIEVNRYESVRVKNESTYWLVFELLWRDFFHFRWHVEGPSFFKVPRDHAPTTGKAFELWTNGETGQPFIDANMKELKLTGFMSNRGRQNVASYWIHHMRGDWTLGAQWFESCLIDYEVCNNYGNWAYLSGKGHDPRNNRVFNPVLQSERYDPKGEYTKYWLE
jgi:deoxyribodipyrimidine photo-lyase